jgi:hypothetical protein
MVVNEAVRGGWLEWLNLIKLKEGQFDREAERARMKANAAEAEVKRRLEAIDKALQAAIERRARAVPAADTVTREHGVAPGSLTEEEHAHVRSLIDRAVTTGGQSLEAAADAQLDSWCTQKDALERALRIQAMMPSSAETSELLLRVAKHVSRAPTANLDAAVQEAIREWQMEASTRQRELQMQASTRERESQMQASRRERDICIAQLCDADEGLLPDEKRMVERRAKRGGDGAEVAVQRAIRELLQDEVRIAESVARLTGLSNRAAQQLQQEALGSVYERGEKIPAAVERLFLEMQARAAVQEAAVQSMSGEERALLTKAVQVAIGRGEDATMATAREVARHQQVRTEVQGALRAKASLLGPKFDARSLEGRVCMAVLRGSPLAGEVAKHVKEFQEGLITEQTVWDTGANSTSQPETLKFNPLQQEAAEAAAKAAAEAAKAAAAEAAKAEAKEAEARRKAQEVESEARRKAQEEEERCRLQEQAAAERRRLDDRPEADPYQSYSFARQALEERQCSVICVSDIHGRCKELIALWDALMKDLGSEKLADTPVVFLGEYVLAISSRIPRPEA